MALEDLDQISSGGGKPKRPMIGINISVQQSFHGLLGLSLDW